MKHSKKLLIIVGPQGSGNHIFARIFSFHPDVKGWEELKEKYWVKHNRENFSEYWWYPELMKPSIFEGSEYFLTNVSYPYNFDGYTIQPKILEVADKARIWGVDVSIAIICRDEEINRSQQFRLRKRHTLDSAREYFTNVLLPSNIPVHFLSLETFFCYKLDYLKYIKKIIDFPIDIDNPEILKYIDESPNKKYITPVDKYWLDKENVIGVDINDLSRNREDDLPK